MFKNKTLLITGGTGSFGLQICNLFLKTDIGEIRIFEPGRENRTICGTNLTLKS